MTQSLITRLREAEGADRDLDKAITDWLIETYGPAKNPSDKPIDWTSSETRMVVLRRNCDAVPTVWCDPEIADLVDALNDVGLRTIASCSGHGHRPGVITMADHRHLLILSKAEFDALNELFPVDINGVLRPDTDTGGRGS